MINALFIALIFIASFTYGESNQPPLKSDDPVAMENFNQIYNTVDSYRITTDGETVCIGDPVLCVDYGNGGITVKNLTNGTTIFEVNNNGSLTVKESGGSTAFNIDSSGNITHPLRSMFSSTNSSDQLNVTGDGTAYTIQFNSEIEDRGGDFSSNTFTAPEDGEYLLILKARLSGVTSSHNTISFRIETSISNYTDYIDDVDAGEGSFYTMNVTAIADMDANDTATAVVVAFGSTKVIDIASGRGGVQFAGYKLP